ncbi:hypothetical protein RJ640_026021 [Escallonia rubra]|uniref:NAF domain-containing protein n=1 Tax=Escallonia rubra TaxID=112253 RepID=A0AA88RBN6_9ASTE|nr:hypothetical protein RJ640_026021 [Escallonia rubra]
MIAAAVCRVHCRCHGEVESKRREKEDLRCDEKKRVDLSPLFEENKREEKEEMRFATARPASCVISKLEEVGPRR